MLQRYQNILKKSAVTTDGLSLDTSIDSQDGSTHKFDDDSTQDTDFYSTFISNYREINKITIAREKERELNEKIRREMRTPKKIYRKRRNTMRDYMVFDPVFNKYFYNRFKSSSDDNDFEYYYYSDEEKSSPSKQNSKIKTVSKDIVNTVLKYDMPIESKDGVDCIKVFVWDTVNNMKPYCKNAVFK